MGVSRDFNRFTRGTLDKRRVREGCGDRGGQGMGMSRTGCGGFWGFGDFWSKREVIGKK